jgi:hypothetical protein
MSVLFRWCDLVSSSAVSVVQLKLLDIVCIMAIAKNYSSVVIKL